MYKYDSRQEVNKLWPDLGFPLEQSKVLDCKARLQLEAEDLGFKKEKFSEISLDALLIYCLEQGLDFKLEVFDGNKEQVDNSEASSACSASGTD